MFTPHTSRQSNTGKQTTNEHKYIHIKKNTKKISKEQNEKLNNVQQKQQNFKPYLPNYILGGQVPEP